MRFRGIPRRIHGRPPWRRSQRYTRVIVAMPIVRQRLGRLVTLIASGALVVSALTPSPYVIEQEGPAYDTLGTVSTSEGSTGRPVVEITGAATHPTSGSLYMLTVNVVGSPAAQPTWVQTLVAWADPDRAVLPMDLVYQPGTSAEEEDARTEREMTASQQDAITAALDRLGYTDPATAPQISIHLDDVGGPSAGLMFALAIIDKLGTESLTGGQSIAGTGTIDAQGAVGRIGGIRQKILAARDRGAQWFLAPSGNCDDLRGAIPAQMTVLSVDTLDDAVTALEQIAVTKSADGLPQCER
ncbi:Lon protease [Pseudoclavibacter caeni]|uniref:endopeptidase La n=2 Tax=Pseudoclavibacter caeni TaxID=908846 RepID=A0A7C8FTM0_9MICO|nr:Lon protease [Pseudoclavibacter caeni]